MRTNPALPRGGRGGELVRAGERRCGGPERGTDGIGEEGAADHDERVLGEDAREFLRLVGEVGDAAAELRDEKDATARAGLVNKKPLEEANARLVAANKELEAQIFSYGPQVEVLQPLWLRQQIEEKIAETLKNYSSGKKDCTE